jgi:hypothetical protein
VAERSRAVRVRRMAGTVIPEREGLDSQRSMAWQLSQASNVKKAAESRRGQNVVGLVAAVRLRVGRVQAAVKRIATRNSLEKIRDFGSGSL